MTELKIIIPVYNEEDAIETVIKDWSDTLSSLKINFKICAFNDGSKDDTSKILHELKSKYPNLVVTDKPNSGHGPTILKGYRDNLDVDWLFQVDSDDELRANEFEKFWKAREEFDFLIGKRIHRESPLPRIVTTQISRMVVKLFYGTKVKDVNAPFRLMRVATFKDDIVRIPTDTFAPNLIIAGLASLRKMRVKQFDVRHHERETGEVSIKKWSLFKAAFKSFLQTIKFRFS